MKYIFHILLLLSLAVNAQEFNGSTIPKLSDQPENSLMRSNKILNDSRTNTNPLNVSILVSPIAQVPIPQEFNGSVIPKITDSVPDSLKRLNKILNDARTGAAPLNVAGAGGGGGAGSFTTLDVTDNMTVANTSTSFRTQGFNVLGPATVGPYQNGMLSLNTATGVFRMGDLGGTGSGTKMVITDGTSNVTITGNSINLNQATTGTVTVGAALSMTAANRNVTLSPTGTGTVTINPATAGSINNVAIGGTTPAAGTFTTLIGGDAFTRFMADSGGVTLHQNASLKWASSGIASPDTILLRDAANTLAMRNGTNAQALRIYNTYTDSSNYNRLSISSTGSTVSLDAQNAGTGGALAIALGAGTGQSVRLFAGGSEIVRASSSGLTFPTDNTYDIGASGATRPRNVYAGTGVVTPTLDSPAATPLVIKTGGTTRWTMTGSQMVGSNNASLKIYIGNLEVQAGYTTLTNTEFLTLRSGGANTQGYMTIGRTGPECYFGVAANAGEYFPNTGVGDIALQSINGPLWFGRFTEHPVKVSNGTIYYKSAANSKAGTFTLVAGAATISNTSITANSVVRVTVKTVGGTRAGNPDIVPTAGVGFTAAGGASDTSTYNYIVDEIF